MQFFPMQKVVPASSLGPPELASPLAPSIYISIAVDCAYLIGQQGRIIDAGIFMVDNMIMKGSSKQGSMELNTVGDPGSIIGWDVFPIDPYLPNLALEITFIQICTGAVFHSPPIRRSGPGFSWLGQLMTSGQQTYAIQIKVTEGLNPVSYYVNWQASVTCH